MKFTTSAVALVAFFVSTASTLPVKRDADPNLVPDTGFSKGRNPTGTGDCDGAVNGPNGQPIKIPCACPPDRGEIIAALNSNLNAGHVVNNPNIPPLSFPTGNSPGEQVARIQSVLITLQNLNGPGKGCPAVSTTLLAQQKAIQAGGNAAPPPPPPPPPAAAAAAPPVSQVAALAPDLGHQSGLNPTGTGDCDGVPGPNGVPVKIPCSCPPDRATFIRELEANVAAGHAVRNPGVAISYPLGNSREDQRARITASLITLQNLKGPGVGCPAVSTTLLQQQKALGS